MGNTARRQKASVAVISRSLRVGAALIEVGADALLSDRRGAMVEFEETPFGTRIIGLKEAMLKPFEEKTEIDQLRTRNAELEAELQDIKDSYRHVMEEKCPTDEVHCTCVPALRAEVARLRKALENAAKDIPYYGMYHKTKAAIVAALEASDG